jgi:hypothetical protein
MNTPLTFRRSTASCCRNAASSASSRLLDSNSEVNNASKKEISAVIADDVRRFGHQINTDGVFGTQVPSGVWNSPAEVAMLRRMSVLLLTVYCRRNRPIVNSKRCQSFAQVPFRPWPLRWDPRSK